VQEWCFLSGYKFILVLMPSFLRSEKQTEYELILGTGSKAAILSISGSGYDEDCYCRL